MQEGTNATISTVAPQIYLDLQKLVPNINHYLLVVCQLVESFEPQIWSDIPPSEFASFYKTIIPELRTKTGELQQYAAIDVVADPFIFERIQQFAFKEHNFIEDSVWFLGVTVNNRTRVMSNINDFAALADFLEIMQEASESTPIVYDKSRMN